MRELQTTWTTEDGVNMTLITFIPASADSEVVANMALFHRDVLRDLVAEWGGPAA